MERKKRENKLERKRKWKWDKLKMRQKTQSNVDKRKDWSIKSYGKKRKKKGKS